MSRVTLYDVIDTRTGQYYSIAIVKEKLAKYFVPANEAEDEVE